MPEPEPNPPPLAPAALVVGCGYLGQRVARQLLERGRTVFVTTRSPGKAAKLGRLGLRPLLLDVTQPLTLASLAPAVEAEALDVVCAVPPGRTGGDPSPRQVVIEGGRAVLRKLAQANVRRAVLISSSAVYGQRRDERVSADTAPEPGGERAKLLLEGERQWLDAGAAYHVLRLAGLYGPGRIVGAAAVRQGAPVLGDPQALLNLIHVDDAADLVLAMLTSEAPGRIELGSSGNPSPRISYYQELARRLGVPEPICLDADAAAEQFGLNAERLRRSSSKSLDPGPTIARTGWEPRHPDFRAALDELLPAAE
ncbi:MAG: NAD-dependent epimerase/dehydratase family protein [Phycisphaeraceae bacterium]